MSISHLGEDGRPISLFSAFVISTLTEVRTHSPSIQRISLTSCSNASMFCLAFCSVTGAGLFLRLQLGVVLRDEGLDLVPVLQDAEPLLLVERHWEATHAI